MKSIISDSVKIFYNINVKDSDKPTLVFIHGWVANMTIWNKEVDFFNKQGFSTLQIDLRGHGLSDKPENISDYSFEKFAKDINLIIDKEKLENFVLIGHSMGGMISLKYYEMFSQKVSGLILCSTTSNFLKFNKIKTMSPFVNHVVSFLEKNVYLKDDNFKHLQEFNLSKLKSVSEISLFLKGLENTPLKSVLSCLEVMFDFNIDSVLSKIDIPTLIIEGENDHALPIKNSYNLSKHIESSDIKIISDANHAININNSDEMNDLILDFFKRKVL